MDSQNARYLRQLLPEDPRKIRPLLQEKNVADPWYTGDFAATWQDLNLGCRRILEELK